MARHRIPAQALRNFLSILAGFLIGGLNNLVVLPWAFEGHLEEWGLVRVAAAWGTLIGPLLAFSAPAAINRYTPRFKGSDELPQLHGSLLHPLLLSLAILVVLPSLLVPEATAELLGLEDDETAAVRPIACIAGIQALQVYFAAFLSSRLKTALATFINETLIKLGYLSLAVALGMGLLGLHQFLPAFVGLYALALTLLVSQALANQYKLDIKGFRSPVIRKELLTYGASMILGSGAWVILAQIDVIMVGRLMGLQWVPAFTIAAFIGTVTAIPMRSFMRLAQPLISNALNKQDMQEVWRITRLCHRSMLLGGGWILTSIWVSTPQIDLLMKPEFKGLGVVIGTIGLFKVINASALGSTLLIGQSSHYRRMIGLNWLMVGLAIPLNFLFIPESGLGLGLLGAALATLLALCCSITLKQWVVWRIWQTFIPQRQSLLIIAVLAVPALLLHGWTPPWEAPITLIVKGIIVSGWVGSATLLFKLLPEGVKPLAKRWPALDRWT